MDSLLLPMAVPARSAAFLAAAAASSSCSSPQPAEPFLLPNALRRRRRFSLGVDLGSARTGLALGKGLTAPRPLAVLELRGQRLEASLVEIAEREGADELIIGLPLSIQGHETAQSNKVRSVAGRLAAGAAGRGLRVYLQDENGTSMDALHLMVDLGTKRSARRASSDAYAAVVLLERYFSTSGNEAQFVLPKQTELVQKLRLKLQCNAE